MSQHNEERNLENNLPLLLETIEEDDAEQFTADNHCGVENHVLQHNGGAAHLFWRSASQTRGKTPEESTVGRTVVSVVMNTGETMLKVFTLVVVYPPALTAPKGPEITGC